jgi:transcriptional regulator with XRE-family HTH domain
MTPTPNYHPSPGVASLPISPRSSKRKELGDFLRRRRETLSPAEAGLPAGQRRRTPGLRRHEVAELANMSTVYYERLEQGRGPQPSPTVLAGMAIALGLSADERDHLYRLAGHAAPPALTIGEEADPNLASVLHGVGDTMPGFISNDLGDLMVQNRINILLFGDLVGRPGRVSNLVYRWFAVPGWRDHFGPSDRHDLAARFYVADLRAEVTRRGNDPAATALVADLRTASDEFRCLWDQHDVSALYCSFDVVDHERTGPIAVDCKLITSPHSRQRLLLMEPADAPARETLARLSTYN